MMETLKPFQSDRLMLYHFDYLRVQCLVLLILPNFLWIGEYEWSIKCITVVTMLGYIEGFNEYSSLQISYWVPKLFEEGPLLGLKDYIKDGDKLWTVVGSSDYVFVGINWRKLWWKLLRLLSWKERWCITWPLWKFNACYCWLSQNCRRAWL